MEKNHNSSFYLLRKCEEIETIFLHMKENKKATKSDLDLIEKKVFIIKIGLKTNLFNKN